MSSSLYNRDILRLAASLIPDDRLDRADGVSEARAPLCGSRIQAEIAFTHDDKISALALRASACALGQASAAILKANAVGSDLATMQHVRAQIADMLTGNGPPPQIWPDLALLAPAKDYPSRHAAILLPYDALLAAAEQRKIAS
ncbi:MAG: iron-sulfur cluster assembly scaffold protein [Sphingorhabdus sp.]